MYLTFLVEVIAQLCYMKTEHCDSKWKDDDQLAKIYELKLYNLKNISEVLSHVVKYHIFQVRKKNQPKVNVLNSYGDKLVVNS